ncbi:MAG: amino acid ABC transporter substrate-binding protein [Paracoccaceae bacterium]
MLRTVLASAACLFLAAPLAAQTLDRIKETGQLNLGFRTDAAPLSFLDENGNPAGYSPIVCGEVAQNIATALDLENLSVKFVPVDAADRFDKVVNGEIDLLCGAATITISRRAQVDFSVPTYVDGTAVMQPRDASGDLTQLAGKSVGVRSNTTTEQALNNTLSASGLEMNLVTYEDHRDGMQAMIDGDIEAYFADQSILLYLFSASQEFGNFRVSPEILSVEKQGLAMARGATEFRLLVDGILGEMFLSGQMAEIFRIALPGIEPGRAMQAMYVTSPTIP